HATNPVVPEPKNGSSTIPPSGHPASIHGSIKSGGNVAKCAPLNGFVATVHTVRLFLYLGTVYSSLSPLPLGETFIPFACLFERYFSHILTLVHALFAGSFITFIS